MTAPTRHAFTGVCVVAACTALFVCLAGEPAHAATPETTDPEPPAPVQPRDDAPPEPASEPTLVEGLEGKLGIGFDSVLLHSAKAGPHPSSGLSLRYWATDRLHLTFVLGFFYDGGAKKADVGLGFAADARVLYAVALGEQALLSAGFGLGYQIDDDGRSAVSPAILLQPEYWPSPNFAISIAFGINVNIQGDFGVRVGGTPGEAPAAQGDGFGTRASAGLLGGFAAHYYF